MHSLVVTPVKAARIAADFIGDGVELAVGPHGYVRAEYVRINYNDYGHFGVNIDTHRDQALLGLGLRF